MILAHTGILGASQAWTTPRSVAKAYSACNSLGDRISLEA